MTDGLVADFLSLRSERAAEWPPFHHRNGLSLVDVMRKLPDDATAEA